LQGREGLTQAPAESEPPVTATRAQLSALATSRKNNNRTFSVGAFQRKLQDGFSKEKWEGFLRPQQQRLARMRRLLGFSPVRNSPEQEPA